MEDNTLHFKDPILQCQYTNHIPYVNPSQNPIHHVNHMPNPTRYFQKKRQHDDSQQVGR